MCAVFETGESNVVNVAAVAEEIANVGLIGGGREVGDEDGQAGADLNLDGASVDCLHVPCLG